MTVPFFSLVMPLYGMERYIADSLADVLCQTYRDFELIIVDDCSPDRSVDIVRDLASADERVRMIHHPQNRGLSETRNTGIEAANGTWVMFPDPDDRYDTKLLERLHNELVQSDPDLLIFNHVQEYFDAKGTYLYSNEMHLASARYDTKSEIGRAALNLEKGTHLGYAWNKAYRTELLREYGIRFETVPYIEDVLFNLAYLEHVNVLETMAFCGYHYAKRVSANLTNAGDPRYYEVHRRRIAAMHEMLEQRGCLDDSSRAILGSLYGRYILSGLERTFGDGDNAKLSRSERSAWLDDVFADPLFEELIDLAKADDSRELAFCLRALKARNKPVLAGIGAGIHRVRNTSTKRYTKARSKR